MKKPKRMTFNFEGSSEGGRAWRGDRQGSQGWIITLESKASGRILSECEVDLTANSDECDYTRWNYVTTVVIFLNSAARTSNESDTQCTGSLVLGAKICGRLHRFPHFKLLVNKFRRLIRPFTSLGDARKSNSLT